jgi:hypothetical protein
MHPLKAMKGNKMAHKAKISAVVIVWLDLAINLIHALAHIGANIWLSFFGNAFVVGVILVAPLVSLFLLHTTRLEWLGALLLFFSMLGAFLFGIWNHFLLPGSDNVAHMPPGVWQQLFQVTAVLLTILQAAGTGIGLWCLSEAIRAHALCRAEIISTVRERRVNGEMEHVTTRRAIASQVQRIGRHRSTMPGGQHGSG